MNTRGNQSPESVVREIRRNMSVSFQTNPDTKYLKLRRGFVDLVCLRGVSHEYQNKPESGISSQGYPS